MVRDFHIVKTQCYTSRMSFADMKYTTSGAILRLQTLLRSLIPVTGGLLIRFQD